VRLELILRGGVLVLFPILLWGATPSKGAQTKHAVEDEEIPAAAAARRNPVSSSDEALRGGRRIWMSNCETCHGAEGRGDGPNARLHEARKGRAPRNLTDPAVQENLTDGELYWRISRGILENQSIIMPAFESKIPSETDRWQLVLFVRELGRAGRR
jgi:mono/diheme cytochrome c family protein